MRDKIIRRKSSLNENLGDAMKKVNEEVHQPILLSDRFKFHSTFDIIEAAEKGELPDKIMINMHPQRWNDKPMPWLKEYIGQNIKNVIKRYFFVR